jgi:hypothetical protein
MIFYFRDHYASKFSCHNPLMLDQDTETLDKDETETDDALYCAKCGALMTRTRWAADIGGFERVFINPAGRVFRIACFRESPGAADHGEATAQDTWFPGYAWTIQVCKGCGNHAGWRFEGDTEPRVFFGLIKTALTMSPDGGQA